MKLQKMMLMVVMVFLIVSSATVASTGDFDWVHNLNVRARADLSDFRAQLSTRFKIGGAQVDAVLNNVGNPADAYMVLRLGEMSSRSPEYVMDKYRSEKSNGWGALAKSLGIKPGSSEFHALKRGNDIYDDHGKGNHSKGKGNGKGKK